MATSPHLQISPESLLSRYRTIYNKPDVWEKSLANTDDFENYSAYKNFVGIVGREPTVNEFSQALPYFRGETGDDTGRSYLASLAERESKSPEALGKKAPEQYGKVGEVFQDLLKRGASQDELDHFGRLLATGELTPYELRQFVTQMPEVREKEASALQTKQVEEDRLAREQLGGELGKYDQDFFNKAKENVLSRYVQAGIQNSPALDFALTNLMGDIQKERSTYLADIARRDYESQRGVKREDYLGNKGLLREDYMTNLNRLFGNQDYGRQRGDAYSDALMNRAWNSEDYRIQQRDLLNLMNSQSGRKRGGLGAAIGPLAGAGIGAAIGGPQGAMYGSYFGNAGGNAFDYLNRGY